MRIKNLQRYRKILEFRQQGMTFDAIGRTRTILYGAVLLFVGVALATGPVSEPAALAGFALVGLGVANMVPATFSASAAA